MIQAQISEYAKSGDTTTPHRYRLVEVAESSKKAYKAIFLNGKQHENTRRVFELLLEHREGLTRNQINQFLFGGRSINVVCGRVGDLRKIELACRKPRKTYRFYEPLIITTIKHDEQGNILPDPITGQPNTFVRINPVLYEHIRSGVFL